MWQVPIGFLSVPKFVRVRFALVALLLLSAVLPARASFIAKFDLDGYNNATAEFGPTQAGFTSLTSADRQNWTGSAAGITINVALSSADRDRDRGVQPSIDGYPYADLLRDFVHGNTDQNVTITVTLSGLRPDTEYEARWYHYESQYTDSLNRNRAAIYHNSVASDNLLFFSAVYNSNTDPDVTGFTDFSFTSDINGQVMMVSGAGPGGERNFPYLNGLAIVPEPTSLALLAVASLVLMRRRRS